jgi:hypothetical protein
MGWAQSGTRETLGPVQKDGDICGLWGSEVSQGRLRRGFCGYSAQYATTKWRTTVTTNETVVRHQRQLEPGWALGGLWSVSVGNVQVMPPSEDASLSPAEQSKAGHYEILGETYAKFEFFEHGWNPYSRFLDIDKVDLVLRRKIGAQKVYREVQVKYGKLYEVGSAWERALFDVTSWRFFGSQEFAGYQTQSDFFLAYVLARPAGYLGDIFIFPIAKFQELLVAGIPSANDRVKIYLSRCKGDDDRWVLRRKPRRFDEVNEETCLDVSEYRRNFDLLLP